jgi:hypothetical protein
VKILLNEKYLVDSEVVSKIVEVQQIGNWNAYKYKPIGEPKDLRVLRDSDIVEGNDAVAFQEKSATEELAETKESLTKAELELARLKAYNRIVAEGAMANDLVMEFVNSKTYCYELSKATSEDVLKFVRLRDEAKKQI